MTASCHSLFMLILNLVIILLDTSFLISDLKKDNPAFSFSKVIIYHVRDVMNIVLG